MICPYCKEKEGNKSNTHYLSDNIIRTALNADGSKDRDKGLYFDMSNDSGAVKFNFQQSTPQVKLEDTLGREPSDDEIEKAKKRLFSVDNVFCSECEKLFGNIEREFDNYVLPKFRSSPLIGIESLGIEEVAIIRKYFYLQLWRSSICDKTFQLPAEIEDDLTELLYNAENHKLGDYKEYPLSITYLVNQEEGVTKTQNLVGCISGGNPYIILMNDFVIQFYDSEKAVSFFDLYGLNDKAHFLDYINYREDSFIVKVVSDSERIKFNLEAMKASKGKAFFMMLSDNFNRMYFAKFGESPAQNILESYIKHLIGQDKPMAIKFSSRELENETIKYINSL